MIILSSAEYGLPESITLRHYPDTVTDALRYQIGAPSTKQNTEPIYNKEGRVIGEQPTTEVSVVFHMLAHGSTLEIAKQQFAQRILCPPAH